MQWPAICVCVLPILISYCHFLCLCSLGLNLFLVQNKLNLVTLQINADGVKRNFYPGDKLPLWHDELEPHNSLLDILAAGNPDPMVQWTCPPLPLWTFHCIWLVLDFNRRIGTIPAELCHTRVFTYCYHTLVNSCLADWLAFWVNGYCLACYCCGCIWRVYGFVSGLLMIHQ